MRLKFAIIVILSTFNLFVHSMDNPSSSSGKKKRNPFGRLTKHLSKKHDTGKASRMTEVISQDVPSSSHGIQYELPHLVSPELDLELKQKYGLQLNLLREGKMSKRQFDGTMKTAAKNVFDKMIDKHYEIYANKNLLTHNAMLKLIPHAERMALFQRLDNNESGRQKLIAEYNWLQKVHLNKPDEQVGLDSEIHRVQGIGEHYMNINYINCIPVRYYLDYPHKRD